MAIDVYFNHLFRSKQKFYGETVTFREINSLSMIEVWNDNNCLEKKMQSDSPCSAKVMPVHITCYLTWTMDSYTKIICDIEGSKKKADKEKRKRFARFWDSHEQNNWDWIWFSPISAVCKVSKVQRILTFTTFLHPCFVCTLVCVCFFLWVF